MDEIIDRVSILDYAIRNGIQQAYNLLLLLGPDAYVGDYDDMMWTLEEVAKLRGETI